MMAAESEPSYKRQKSPKKLCVICRCDDEFNIFIVDVNGGGGGEDFVKTAPNLRLGGFGGGSYFCVIGSILYIFDASGGVPVYEINLNDEKSKSDLVVERSSMHPSTAAMPSRKFTPHVVPTPDGKVLVLSSSVFFYCPEDLEFLDEDEIIEHHFGLFDPITKSWKNLPELCLRPAREEMEMGGFVFQIRSGFDDKWEVMPATPPPYRNSNHNRNIRNSDGSHFNVSGASFTNKHTLLVHVTSDRFGMSQFVTLDLESPEKKGWQLYKDWIQCIQRPIPRGNLIVVEDRLVLSARSCYVRMLRENVGSELDELPLSDFPVGGSSRAIVLKDYLQDKECSFCVIRAGSHIGFDYRNEISYIVVDVFDCHLSQLELEAAARDRRGWATLKASFKFRTKSNDSFFIDDTFMISPTPPSPFKAHKQAFVVKRQEEENEILLLEFGILCFLYLQFQRHCDKFVEMLIAKSNSSKT